MPPDLVIFTLALASLQALDHLQRSHLFPRLSFYNALPPATRFDFDRRFFNLQTQLISTALTLHLLFLDHSIPPDYLYAYPPHAHVVFLLLLAAYVHDAAGIVMHPAPASNARLWLFHHAVAGALLVWNLSYRRVSAFPAAAFLVGGGGHVVNELRWFAMAAGVRRQAVINALHVLCVSVCFLTCALPPPYLLKKVAAQMEVSVWEVLAQRMKAYCTFFFLLIYVPHVVLVGYQMWRAHQSWGMPLPAFRPKKMD